MRNPLEVNSSRHGAGKHTTCEREHGLNGRVDLLLCCLGIPEQLPIWRPRVLPNMTEGLDRLIFRMTFLRLEIKRMLSIADPGGEPTVVSDPL